MGEGESRCDYTPTTGELRVRLCMQRRALAFQIANVATFVTLDSFIAKLFALLTKKPIAGYKVVSLAQCSRSSVVAKGVCLLCRRLC